MTEFRPSLILLDTFADFSALSEIRSTVWTPIRAALSGGDFHKERFHRQCFHEEHFHKEHFHEEPFHKERFSPPPERFVRKRTVLEPKKGELHFWWVLLALRLTVYDSHSTTRTGPRRTPRLKIANTRTYSHYAAFFSSQFLAREKFPAKRLPLGIRYS